MGRQRRFGAGATMLAAVAATVLAVHASGCDADRSPDGTSTVAAGRAGEIEDEPDARLRVHAVEPSAPTREGLAYVRAVADVLGRAEVAQGDARVQLLRGGLSLPVPAGLGEAEILRLEMAATLGETLLERPQGAPVVQGLLAPMLQVERSLPMDRATARALVVLGDASVKTGRDALAAGSYMRAIKIMTLLREELVR